MALGKWQKEVLDGVLRRLSAAETPADKGALAREAVRLAGGTALFQPDRFELGDVPFERFGLKWETAPDGLRLSTALAFPQNLPSALAAELADVLPVDPAMRRPERPVVADAALLRFSPHQCYRNPTQKAAVRAVLTMPPGATLLATMATGTGKSLLFQLPARRARELANSGLETTVVLVPTIALAFDHEASSQSLQGLEGARALTADHNPALRSDVIRAFHRGDVPLLFVSPEAALGSLREDLIRAARPLDDPSRPLAARGRIGTLVVDEAHIVATWGRSFRPDLQRIPALVRALRAQNPALKVILLSATVDEEALDLLRTQYAEPGRAWLHVSEGVPRREFDIVRQRYGNAEERERALLALVDVLPRPALVYTTEVEDAEALTVKLRVLGYQRIACFTGDTAGAERRRIVSEWRNGQLDLIIGTSAFGMGIDQREVRAVVHACLPESASRYYQEIGRGGRDGHQALAVLLTCPSDERTARRLAVGSTLTRETALSHWRGLYERVRIEGTDSFTGRLVYRFDLTAPPQHLAGVVTGRRNVLWNKSLLVQLQRYGTLEVAVSDENRDTWLVVPKSSNSPLFSESLEPDVLDAIFNHRDREEERARRSIGNFRALFEQDEECVLAALFDLVDTAAIVVNACGRCPRCRSHGLPPSREVAFGGVTARWPETPPSRSPTRVLPLDDTQIAAYGRWVRFLHSRGVRQLVAPSQTASEVAGAWAELAGDPGWVLDLDDVLADEPFPPLLLPTALILPPNPSEAARAWRWALAFRESGGPVVLAVAPPGAMLGNERFEDVATNRPPLTLPTDEGSDE